MADDRLARLLDDPAFIGVDFIRVEPTQTTLFVFFLGSDAKVAPFEAAGAFTTSGPGRVRIRSTSPDSDRPEIAITGVSWEPLATFGRRCLRVNTATPGDFSIYQLSLLDLPPNFDPYYASLRFTFKAGCESRLDCKPAEPECPPQEQDDVAVDYTARDWNSYRTALLDMVAQRHPQYVDRLEADLGILFLETLAAVADELTYSQDRIALEAHLETATQRRSVRRHARFVDYEMHDGLAASTWLLLEVSESVSVPAGTSAVAPDGSTFEVGENIHQIAEWRDAGLGYPLEPELNALEPYIWDEDATCLPEGSTTVDVKDHVAAPLAPPRRLLLRAVPDDPSEPIRHAWVVVEEASEHTDPLTGEPYTRLYWSARWATPEPLDLERLTLHANLVPVVAGAVYPPWNEAPARFSIRTANESWNADAPHAIEREGRWTQAVRPSACAEEGTEDIATSRPVTYLYSLTGSADRRLAWVPIDKDVIGEVADSETLGRNQQPEVWLRDQDALAWDWQRTMLGTDSSGETDRHFTLEDGLWEEVVRYWRDQPDPIRHFDYRTGEGFSIRFGDGEFGARPARGTTFDLRYRLSGGSADNLPAGRPFSLTDPVAGPISAVSTAFNPLPIVNGLEPENLTTARMLAPEAWRAVAYRAVTTDDYAEALERLDSVERAAASIRWTGSWHSVFATPDPVGRTTLTAAARAESQAQLERFRLAGRPAFVKDPVYAWLDLNLKICVAPERYRGQVQAEVRRALVGTRRVPGFFHPDLWTFGNVLHRSALEAAIHAVPGVHSVLEIRVRRRGFFAWQTLPPAGLQVEVNAVIGVQDDPLHPERGSLSFEMEGGA